MNQFPQMDGLATEFKIRVLAVLAITKSLSVHRSRQEFPSADVCMGTSDDTQEDAFCPGSLLDKSSKG